MYAINARDAKETRSVMPDIAHEAQAAVQGRLDHVGMSGIEIPVRLPQADGSLLVLPAKADAFVSLDQPEAKGIHMSRLFLTLEELLSDHELDAVLVERLLRAFIRSHRDLSMSSHVRLAFELPLRRPALRPQRVRRHHVLVGHAVGQRRGVGRNAQLLGTEGLHGPA